MNNHHGGSNGRINHNSSTNRSGSHSQNYSSDRAIRRQQYLGGTTSEPVQHCQETPYQTIHKNMTTSNQMREYRRVFASNSLSVIFTVATVNYMAFLEIQMFNIIGHA